MKCSVHSFATDGKCSRCGKRRPGRPRNRAGIIPSPAASAPARVGEDPSPTVDSPPVADSLRADRAERSERLRSLFAPPPEVRVVHDEPEPEPEPKRKTTVKGDTEDWAWVAGAATEGIDVAAGWAIGAWSDLEPMEASASSRKRFAGKLGVFAEQRLGAVEVPTWIVLVICLVALIASKVVGAPRKAEADAMKKPAAPAAPPAPAPIVATSIPVAAPVAANTATPIPPQPKQPLTTEGAGNVYDAQSGF